jgi:DNA-binding beta-propeller fold protein YncE
VDPYKENTVWLVDVGSHTVSEFDVHSQSVVGFAGRHLDPTWFCKPTDIAFSRDQKRLFVTDG